MLFLLHRPEELMPIHIVGGSDSGLQVVENMNQNTNFILPTGKHV